MTKIEFLIKAIRIKISRGDNLENILESYINLTDDEKQQIRDVISN